MVASTDAVPDQEEGNIMTDDQCDRLNRFLAEMVLGWKFDQPPPDRSYYCRMAKTLDAPVWISMPGGAWQCGLCNGSPDFGKWADCEPLLSKIERDGLHWSVDNVTDGGYGCNVWGQPLISGLVWKKRQSGHGWSSSSRTEALCLAIARCYGWKVEG